jgi:hypothetical protein
VRDIRSPMRRATVSVAAAGREGDYQRYGLGVGLRMGLRRKRRSQKAKADQGVVSRED